VNAPPCSSVGRLFDAFAAALGVCRDSQSYEGEAAMRLEALVKLPELTDVTPYPFGFDGQQIDPAPMFHAWLKDQRANISASVMAARFHLGLAHAFCAPARDRVLRGEARAVVLSGGCFQNLILHRACLAALVDVPVLVHQRIPANDGGLALGQALIAAARTARVAS
jgi:hydrogenase maturation protein HypF